MIPVLYLIALIALIIASYTDIKTKEVPDWLNFSLIGIGFGIRALYSIISWNYNIILYGIFGFTLFLILALIMYYLGQWGGGDSKMMMGLGATIGLTLSFSSFIIQFLILILIIGGIYGLIYSIILAILNKKKFLKKFVELNLKYIKAKKILIGISVVFFILSFFVDIYMKIYILILILMILISFYVWVFAKSVELVYMYKVIPVNKLTEGDWIVNDLIIKGERITGPKDLGIEKKQIEKLKKLKVKEILIKEGIPFIPSFLIAFVVNLILYYFNIVLVNFFVI